MQQLIGEDSGSGYGGDTRSRRWHGRGRGHYRGKRGWYNHRGNGRRRDERVEETDKEHEAHGGCRREEINIESMNNGESQRADKECEKDVDLKVIEVDKNCTSSGTVEETSPDCSNSDNSKMKNLEQEVTNSESENTSSTGKVESLEKNEDLVRDGDMDAGEKACENLVGAIMADVASQISDVGTNKNGNEVGQVTGEQEEGEIPASEKEGKSGRGGRKRWNKERNRQKNAKRKISRMETSLQNIPVRKPTLLEKVCFRIQMKLTACMNSQFQ